MKQGKLRVLHLASFAGNIGDTANHEGFYQKFKENVFDNVIFEQLEIRKFYRNCAEMKYDNAFVKMVNRYDLLVLGGGGFFDLGWDYSSTGTTIDFSQEILDKLKTPVLVNAMGYHELGEIEENNINKFNKFLEAIIHNDKWFISVRNDGSYSRLRNRYGSMADKILKMPDHGFFFNHQGYYRLGLENEDRTWIGMNITNDLFSKSFNLDIDANTSNKLIGQFINRILDENNNFGIILFPHTPQDLVTIGTLMGIINEKNKRERIVVAPYISNGREAVKAIFDLMRICACMIGMRFHSNVCSIGRNIPTIGLAGHEQIAALYDELGLSERCIKISNKLFVDELLHKLDESLNNLAAIKQKYAMVNEKLNNQANFNYIKLKKWFEQQIV